MQSGPVGDSRDPREGAGKKDLQKLDQVHAIARPPLVGVLRRGLDLATRLRQVLDSYASGEPFEVVALNVMTRPVERYFQAEQLRATYAGFGAQLSDILLDIVIRTSEPREALAGTAVMVAIGERQRLVADFIVPCLMGTLPAEKKNLGLCIDIGKGLTTAEIHTVIEGLDLDRIWTGPGRLALVASALFAMADVTSVLPLLHRCRKSYDGVPGFDAEGECASRLALLVLEKGALAPPKNWNMPAAYFAAAAELYGLTRHLGTRDGLASLLINSDYGHAAIVFAAALEPSDSTALSFSPLHRFRATSHMAEALIDTPNGLACLVARLRRERDPVVLLGLCHYLTGRKDGEGPWAVAKIMQDEVTSQSDPCVLSTMLRMSTFEDISEVLEVFLSTSFAPELLERALKRTATTEIMKLEYQSGTLLISDDVEFVTTLPVDVVEEIGMTTIAQWGASPGSIASNTECLLNIASRLDPGRLLIAASRIGGVDPEKKGFRALRVLAGVANNETIDVTLEPTR